MAAELETRAAFGDAARAAPSGMPLGRAPHDPPCKGSFPPLLEGRGYPAGQTQEQFPRYQSAALTLAAVSTWQEVVRFAGRPQRVTVAASAAGVNVRLRNRGETDTDAIRIPAAQFHHTHIGKDIVEAQDPTGAGGQIVSVQGAWTDPATS